MHPNILQSTTTRTKFLSDVIHNPSDVQISNSASPQS